MNQSSGKIANSQSGAGNVKCALEALYHPEIEEAIKLYYEHNKNSGANLNRLIVAQDKTV